MIWLVKYFFQKVQGLRGFLVFDNVDFYVDIEQSFFTDDVSLFVREALRVEHDLTIVFTCRPRIAYASHRFRDIYLRGLTSEESEQLFRARMKSATPNDVLQMVPEFCERCEGHPLWLNIIASQVGRKPGTAKGILNDLRGNLADSRATALLKAVWSSLAEGQRQILTCMAEIPRAIEESEISYLVEDEFQNRNRFTKAFRALAQISLLTEKSSDGAHSSRFDLHPLVRTFVRQESYGPKERSELIIRILVWCNQTIVDLSDEAGARYLERMVMRAELEFNSGQQDKALKTISECYTELDKHGLLEEFIRLGRLVLDHQTGSWKRSALWGSPRLHIIVRLLIKNLLELGRIAQAKEYLAEYEAAVDTGTARYIGLCDLQAYAHWFQNEFVEAVEVARRGCRLTKESGIDTDVDCSHNLALALRDSGSIPEAISIFLGDSSILAILKEDLSDTTRHAHYFGNIARCFQLQGRYQTAMAFLTRSFSLLARKSSADKDLNLGYAAFWIGECLLDLGQLPTAKRFLQYAADVWSRRAPPKSEDVMKKLFDLELFDDALDADLAASCNEWVDSWIQSNGDCCHLVQSENSEDATDSDPNDS